MSKNFGKVKYFRNRAIGTIPSLETEVFIHFALAHSQREVVGMLIGIFLENPKKYSDFDFKPLKIPKLQF